MMKCTHTEQRVVRGTIETRRCCRPAGHDDLGNEADTRGHAYDNWQAMPDMSRVKTFLDDIWHAACAVKDSPDAAREPRLRTHAANIKANVLLLCEEFGTQLTHHDTILYGGVLHKLNGLTREEFIAAAETPAAPAPVVDGAVETFVPVALPMWLRNKENS
jgi:hypothetical protein